MKLFNPLVLTSLLLGSLASAHDYTRGDLHIEHPWSRELPEVAPSLAAYFTLENLGSSDDQLLGASSPIAGRVELHEHVHVEGRMKMQAVSQVAVPASGRVEFRPMTYHVMLFDLKQHPKSGEVFPLTLHFARAGDVAVEVTVQKEAPSRSQNHAH